MSHTWHFNPSAFGTGFALANTINSVIKKHNLHIKKIFRLGPRFFIAMCTKGKKNTFFKICLEYWTPATGIKTTPKSEMNEIEILITLNKSKNHTLKTGVPRIIDSNINEYIWMLRDLIPGKTQNIKGSNFLFTKKFFTSKNIEWLTLFFLGLQNETAHLPSSLKKSIHAHTLLSYEQCIDWKGVLSRHKLGSLVAPMKTSLNACRKIFDCAPKVLTHHEPYASHFIKDSNDKLHLIDWENIGLNNPLHDMSIMWMRGFENIEWQNNLLVHAQKKMLPKKNEFDAIIKAEMLLQSVGNISFFSKSILTKEEKQVKRKIIPYFVRLIKKHISV